MLLTDVVIGKDIQLTRDELPLNAPARGYDSVQVVSGHSNSNGKPKCEERIVYTSDAIRPSFLVIYG